MPYILVIIGIVALDQLVKYYISTTMTLGESIPVISDVFHITLLHNSGAAFSILEGNTVVLLALPIVIAAVGVYLIMKYRREWSKFLLVSIAMIVGGGIGNLIDRGLNGYVVDLFDFQVFPIFNVADIFVTLGCVLLVVDIFILEDVDKDAEAEDEANEKQKQKNDIYK